VAPFPDASDDLAYLSATELARRIAAKEFSPVGLLEDTLTSDEHRNPELNGFVYLATAQYVTLQGALSTQSSATPIACLGRICRRSPSRANR
jgi:Asp-tRNA(Asn)/Glu-tRNA(Gln) amidotransferase A subunit family amidase